MAEKVASHRTGSHGFGGEPCWRSAWLAGGELVSSRIFAHRLERLGLGAMADHHVMGDGASWIWKSADRALSSCGQTSDVYHACEHIAEAGKKPMASNRRLPRRSSNGAAIYYWHWRRVGTASGQLVGEECARGNATMAALVCGRHGHSWSGSLEDRRLTTPRIYGHTQFALDGVASHVDYLFLRIRAYR
jgi:hypothetical protein